MRKLIINRLFNNNIAMVNTTDGKELVVVGKGIVYGLKKGDCIDESIIEKKFELKKEARTTFERIIQDMPIEYVIVSEEIISYIKSNIDKELDERIYVTLTDHISATMERFQMGISFDMTMLLNVKILYPEEYRLGLHAVKILKEKLNVDIDDSEAIFITLHIIDAESKSNMSDYYTISIAIDEIMDIAKKYFDINEGSYYCDRFLTHLRFFIQRVDNNEIQEKDIDDEFSEVISSMNEKFVKTKQEKCVEEIAIYIEHKKGYKVSPDEKLYLMLHLSKLTRE